MAEYPITARKMGMTDYTKVEFNKRINMNNYPFKKINPGDEPDDKVKHFVCMVGNCSGIIDKKPKKKSEP